MVYLGYQSKTQHGEAIGIFNLGEIESFHKAQLNKGPITEKEISLETQRDPILTKVLRGIRIGWEPRHEISPEVLPYFRCKDELSVEQGCLLRGVRVVIPLKLRNPVLRELHSFHEGIVKMKARARIYCWWPTIDAEIEQTVANCNICRNILPNPPSKTQTWAWPDKPWQRLHADFCGPVEGKMFLLVIDAHSKWLEAVQMSSTTSHYTICALRNIFATHGLPVSLVTDNGPQFASEEFADFMTFCGIRHVKSPPYHPQTNGEAERVVRTFKTSMVKKEIGDFNTRLANFLLGYRTSVHSTTGSSPSEMLMGRKLRTRLDRMFRPKDEVINSHKSDTLNKPRIFEDKSVLVRDYRKNKDKWMNGTIEKQLGPVSYEVRMDEGLWKRHADQMYYKLYMCLSVPVSPLI